MFIKLPNNLGLILLGIWLIAQGAQHFLGITASWYPIVLAILAIVAGLLILITGR